MTLIDSKEMISLNCKDELTSDITQIDSLSEYTYEGYKFYVGKNPFDGWVAYIDVTGIKELQFNDIYEVDSYGLEFHGGCTFCQGTKSACGHDFITGRYLIGCDWCHGYIWSKFQLGRSPTLKELQGVEDVSEQEVIDNIRHVIEQLPEVIVRRSVEGKF